MSRIALLVVAVALLAAGEGPQLRLCAPADPAWQAQAQRLLAACGRQPLLALLAEGRPPTTLDDTAALAAHPEAPAARDHLIIVAPAEDPLVRLAQAQSARVEGGDLFHFGLGWFSGTVGWVEGDRNPFVHGHTVASAPWESQVLVFSGATAAGAGQAVDAFLTHGLINGVAAAPGWKRPRAALLELPPASAPPMTPERVGALVRAGWTQPGADELRDLLAVAGVEPKQAWRIKWLAASSLHLAGAGAAPTAFHAGLHRKALANSLLIAAFADEATAQRACEAVAAASRLQANASGWLGSVATVGDGTQRLRLWRERSELRLGILPEALFLVLRWPGGAPAEAAGTLALLVDFEGAGNSAAGLVREAVAPPLLADGGAFRGRWAVGGLVRVLEGCAIPPRARLLTLSFACLPTAEAPGRYTRLMAYFSDGRTAIGANDGRTPVAAAGAWQQVQVQLALPEGVSALKQLDLSDGAPAGTSAALVIDNLSVRFE